MSNIVKFMRKAAPVLFLLTLLFVPAMLNIAHAAPSGTGLPVNSIDTIATTTDIRAILINVINWILLVVGTVAVLMLIYGGFRYVTSAGNQDQLETAKTVITYAIVGLIVILIAFVIVKTIDTLVLGK